MAGLKGLRALMSIRTTRDTPLPKALPEEKPLDYRGVWMLILACHHFHHPWHLGAFLCACFGSSSPAPLPEPLWALPTHEAGG